jgi:type I restriction enzyme S subunit
VVCDPKSGVDACFYAYVLRHMAVSGYITSLAKGIRERSTSFGWGEMKEEWLPLPELATQKAIADFLDRKTAAVDALIEKKQKLLDLLAEKRAALINRAVTKGLDSNVPTKDSGVPWIGEIPAHWKVLAIKRFADRGYKTFTDGDWIESPFITSEGVRLLQTGNVSIGDFKEKGFRYVSLETFVALRCTEVRPGDGCGFDPEQKLIVSVESPNPL